MFTRECVWGREKERDMYRQIISILIHFEVDTLTFYWEKKEKKKKKKCTHTHKYTGTVCP